MKYDNYSSLRLRLQRLLNCIRQRCQTRPRYAGRGIECRIDFNDLWDVWHRDNAAALDFPTIDRIDNDGHYERSNIRFIEQAENVRRGVKVCDQERTLKVLSK